MKTIKLFAIAAITLGMMACNKNENTEVNPNEGAQATLTVKVDTSSSLRAIGAVPADGTVKSLEVFVYAGDVLEGYGKADNATEVKDIKVTTGDRKMVVVANANLGKVNSLKDLMAKKIEGKVAVFGAPEGDQVDIAMTSETKDITIKAGKNVYGLAAGAEDNNLSTDPLELVKVPARISLISAKTEFAEPFTGWTFEPKAIFVFNVPGNTNYFGSPLAIDGDHFSGIDMTAWTGDLLASGTIKVNAALFDAVDDLSTITENNPAYYYSFENREGSKPVVLTIKGKLKNADGEYVSGEPFADASGFTYYSILVNADRAGYTYTGEDTAIGYLKRNTDYRLSVTIKRPGTGDPTTPPAETATLDVKVEVKPWTKVSQTVVY